MWDISRGESGEEMECCGENSMMPMTMMQKLIL